MDNGVGSFSIRDRIAGFLSDEGTGAYAGNRLNDSRVASFFDKIKHYELGNRDVVLLLQISTVSHAGDHRIILTSSRS